MNQARKLPNLYKARENALVYLLHGEEKHKGARNALIPLSWVISHHLTALAETEDDNEYIKKAIHIIDILFDGEIKNDFVCSIRDKLSSKLKDFE